MFRPGDAVQGAFGEDGAIFALAYFGVMKPLGGLRCVAHLGHRSGVWVPGLCTKSDGRFGLVLIGGFVLR